MVKTIKHNNILNQRHTEKAEQYQIVCRGCTMGQRRQDIWHGFLSSVQGSYSDANGNWIENSYFTFEEEPENRHDQNAVKVVCRGELFGTVGYVGREFAFNVKQILKECNAYRIDIVNPKEVGQRNVRLVVSWVQKTNGNIGSGDCRNPEANSETRDRNSLQ